VLARRSELPLEADPSHRYLPWVIAVMVYLAALALAGALALDAAVSRWGQGLSGVLTVQIPAAEGDRGPAGRAAALVVLRATPGVVQATALSRDQLAALLEPWLGPGNLSPELPIPDLIDVRLAPDADLDLEALARRLEAAAPGAQLDDHKLWLDKVIRLSRWIQLLAAAVVLLIAAAGMAIIVFTTRAGLAVHHDVIEVLHLIGAWDSYIARQFQTHALMLGLRGGFMGLALAALTLFVLSRAAATLEGAFLPALSLGVGGWAALATMPLIAGMIATLTARTTVMRALQRML
jgi:cell division transport system permease protein